jgi:hypothetical protein
MIDLLIPTGKRACDYCTKNGKCILGISVSSNYSGMPQGMKRVSCEAGQIDFGIYSVDVSAMIADAVHGRQRIPAIRPVESETDRLDSLERAELRTLRKRVSEQRKELSRLHDANNQKPPVVVDDPALRQFLGLQLKEVPKPRWKQNKVVIYIEKDSGSFLGCAINGVELPGATGYSFVGDFGIMPCLQVEFGILPRNIIIHEMEGKAVGE